MPRTLRTRLALLFLLAVLPGFALATGYDLYGFEEHVRAAVADLADRVRVVGSADGVLIGDSQLLLRTLANLPQVRQMGREPAACAREVADVLRGSPYYAQAAVIDAAGTVVCTGDPEHPGEARIDSRTVERAMNERRFAIGDNAGAAARVHRIHLAYPVIAQGGKVVGAVELALELNWLNQRFAALALEKGTVLTLVDAAGAVLARYPGPEPHVGRPLAPSVEAILKAGQTSGEAVFGDGETRFFALAPLGGTAPADLALLLSIDRVTLLAPALRDLLVDIATFCLVAVLGMALALLGGTPLLLRPVRKLGAAAARLTAGDLTARVAPPYEATELGRLAAAFDKMAAALEERERELRKAHTYQSRMLAIAGHDLRQPIQIVVMSHDLIRAGGLPERERKYLVRAEEALGRLVHQLDLIAEAGRLEGKALEPRIEAVALGPIIAEIAAEAALAAQRKGLVLRARPTDAVALSDREMLATILRNLVGNAVKYTRRGGILVGCRRDPDGVRIEVHDTGIGIPPERLEEVFGEFYQLDPKNEGLGLGLAIVRRTADMLGHRLAVRSTPGRGSCFSVVLPRAGEAPAMRRAG
ncbi:MAG TPA: sensor histidine kinase [Stellaceae bacterium]|nr:sensor histidine kinase [Stellaceae bacterium]